MSRRPGVTLIEVLVAIFIMAIGMLALLALFPLGAISMAQALKDDRCAQAAVNAEAIAVAQDVRHDVAVAGGAWGAGSFFNAFTNPWNNQLTNIPSTYSGPSFGVIVDPFMFPQDTTAQSVGVVANVTPGVPRRSLVFSANYTPATHPNPLSPTEAARWCSMLDGITFFRGDNAAGGNAQPDTSQGSVVRDGRYTWAWLLRRPQAFSDNVIDLSVIIYSGRPTTTLTGEVTLQTTNPTLASFTNPGPPPPTNYQGATSVTVNFTAGARPSLRNGGWILDVTPTTVGLIPNPNPGGQPIPIQAVYGYPYRVVSVTDVSATQLTLELQTPLRNNATAVTVLEYAVEIIDRGSFVQP